MSVFRECLSIFVCVLRSFEFIFSHLKKGGVTGVAHFIIVNRLNKTEFAFFHLVIGCLGFNGPLRQYFNLYRAVSQRGRRGRKRGE